MELTDDEPVVSSSAGAAASDCSSGGVTIIRGLLMVVPVVLGEGVVTKEGKLPWTANPPAREGKSMHSESFMVVVKGVG